MTRAKIVSTMIRGGRALATVVLANGDTRTRVELMMPYGMTALPEEGSDVLIDESNGNRDHLVATMADTTALRITNLKPGEVGLRDKRGQQVVFREDGVEITGALKVTIVSAGEVAIQAPNVTMSGTLVVQGGITTPADVVAGSISLKGHRHQETDNITNTPI